MTEAKENSGEWGIINCHTHVLPSKGLNTLLYTWPIPLPAVSILRFDLTRKPLLAILRFLSWIIARFGYDALEKRWDRLASLANMEEMIREKMGKTISDSEMFHELFNILKGHYPKDNSRFVLLSLDTEYLFTGFRKFGKKVSLSFYKQLDHLEELKNKYGDSIYPFIHADPRRPNIVELVKDCIETRGFSGIKIYPPFGHLPTGKLPYIKSAAKDGTNKFEKSSKFLSPPQADGVLRNFAPTGTDFS